MLRLRRYEKGAVMSFRIVGLDPRPFAHLFGLPDAELRKRGVIRQIADSKPGFPDRIERAAPSR